MTEQGWKTTGW